MTAPGKAQGRPSEAALVERILEGESTAFDELYRSHQARVYALLTRLLGPVAERDDLLQESFLQLYNALPSFRGESSLSTFLYRIVSRLAAKAGRRRHRDPVAFDSSLIENCFGGEAPRSAQDRQQLEQTFAMLLRVRVDRRIAFVLHTVEGLSYREVGDTLNIAPDAAKQRCLRARRDLKKLLAQTARSQPLEICHEVE